MSALALNTALTTRSFSPVCIQVVAHNGEQK